MICGKCYNEPVVKGIKQTRCVVCEKECHTIINYANVCFDCSEQYNICQSCGENFNKPYDASWVVHVNLQGE